MSRGFGRFVFECPYGPDSERKLVEELDEGEELEPKWLVDDELVIKCGFVELMQSEKGSWGDALRV